MTRVFFRRARRVVPVLLPLVGLLLHSPPAGAGEGPSFSGTVRSSVGAVLEGVEVLVVARPAAPSPVATTTTDDQGHFRIAELSPGVYRIAALKYGYASFVGDIDTRLERWIELTLRPHANLSEDRRAAVPADDSWTLRLPRRHVLRETEATVVNPHETHYVPPAEKLNLQVDQLFAVAPSLEGRQPDDPSMRGLDTRIRHASSLGEARIRTRANRESLEAEEMASDVVAGLGVGFVYDIGDDAQVTAEAFYGQRDLDWTPSGAGSPSTQEHRARAARSGWSKQIDPFSRLAFSVDYQDVSSRLPAEAGAPEVVNRAVGASGTYRTSRSGDHRLEVDFRARSLETAQPYRRAATRDLPGSLDGVEGVTAGVEARDTWHLSGPFSLVYGLGVNHSFELDDASLIVPRLGGSLSFDDAAVSVLLSYHTVADSGVGAEGSDAGVFRPAKSLGYETRVDVPLGESLRLTGSTSYAPMQLDLANDLPQRVTIYLSDGNAELYQNRVGLERSAGNTRTYAELTHGRAEGMLATALSYEIPYQELSQSSLRYLNGRVGLRIVPVGTQLVVEYRQVEERRPAEIGEESATRQESLELRVTQDLMRRHDLGHWRLLMDVRVASMETDSEDWLAAGNARIVDALGGRLRAGLSVEF